ncbi:hypothetical protein IGK11_000270 [Enterococcus sp. AZ146]
MYDLAAVGVNGFEKVQIHLAKHTNFDDLSLL